MTESPESRLRDPERLRVLRETGLIGGRPDESLDHLARLAASVLNVPSALVSLVDDEHQWFTNSVGLPPEMDGVNCTPLSTSFCKYCVIRGEVFAIDDATRAPDLPEANAVAELGVVAYLGAPLRLPDGKVLGALCAIDSVPRRWSESDRQALADLAAAAVPALEIRLREVEGARIRAEAQNSESQFQLFIESAVLPGIYGLDRDGICTFCNPRAVELLGYGSQDELVGRRMHDLIHHTRGDGTAFPREDCGIFKALERNKVVHLESETLWKKNGSSFYADCWSSPVIQDGDVCGAVVSFYDVTQRVLADEMVRVEQEFLQHVIDNVPVFIGVCLTDGTFIRANQTALECGGQHGADVIGRLLWECPWWEGDADAQKRIREAISRAAQGEPVRFDCAMRLGGDERATFDFQIAPMRDAAGKITHLVPSGVDISERSQMEAALQRARLAADDASRAKSDFLANTSHEIRTPMAAILGYAEILGARLGDPDDLSCAENIMRNGEHLVELIDDILDLSKIEAGKIDIEKEAVSIPALIREVCSAMGVRAATKGINLTAVQRGPTPSEVDSDPKRLRQILVNLIGNAIKFTDRGEVRLTIEAVGEGAESAVRFEVADSGKGMTEDEVAQVFQPFHQGDHAEEGAGLRIAISRKLAAMLGGEIYCEHSAPGEGSIFHFDLPYDPSLTLVETWEEGKTMRRRDPGNDPLEEALQTVAGKSILVADDRAEIRGVMQHFLEDAGCVVESAPDGRRALRMAEAARQGGEPYDAMVLDLRMPHADGSEVARRLRDAGYEGAIVIMSAHAMKEIKTQCLGSGCDAFLAKPVAREDLLQTLAEALRKKRKARPGDVRVLVVDDSQDAAEALSLLLGIHGFSAETAHSGESALEVFADSAPQVAIIDIGLPDISGYEVAARIRSKTNHDPDAAPILIALSGRANAEAAPEAVEADFDYYLEKPASAESVAALIRGAIEESAKS